MEPDFALVINRENRWAQASGSPSMPTEILVLQVPSAGSTPRLLTQAYACSTRGERLRQQVNPNPTADVKVSLVGQCYAESLQWCFRALQGVSRQPIGPAVAVGARGKAGNTVCCICRNARGQRPSTIGLQLSCRLVEPKGTNGSN